MWITCIENKKKEMLTVLSKSRLWYCYIIIIHNELSPNYKYGPTMFPEFGCYKSEKLEHIEQLKQIKQIYSFSMKTNKKFQIIAQEYR